eukprot:340267-Rhodomonas_salina.1
MVRQVASPLSSYGCGTQCPVLKQAASDANGTLYPVLRHTSFCAARFGTEQGYIPGFLVLRWCVWLPGADGGGYRGSECDSA